MRLLKPLIVLAFIALALVMWQRHAGTESPAEPANPAAQAGPAETSAARDDLPPEAHVTLARMARGGPFEHRQDGGVFGNHEGLLPKQPRGYYHEYTVETPGASGRGARRIIAGGTPPVVWFYTDDHYRSFRRIEANP
ncbi:MAG: ribonuclease domain-containing protein [Rhodanobacter sp.]